MLTTEHPDRTQREPRARAGLYSRFCLGAIGLISIGMALFSRTKNRRRVRVITSPGQALDGFEIASEDAAMLRRISDPNDPAGKPRLRAGPAMRR